MQVMTNLSDLIPIVTLMELVFGKEEAAKLFVNLICQEEEEYSGIVFRTFGIYQMRTTLEEALRGGPITGYVWMGDIEAHLWSGGRIWKIKAEGHAMRELRING